MSDKKNNNQEKTVFKDTKKESNSEDKKIISNLNNSQVEVKEINEIGKIIKSEIKRKLPEDKLKEVIKSISYNMLVAIVIFIYFVFLCLGYKNIEKNIFIIDLKVFSISLTVMAIYLFERYYKIQERKFFEYGIELLIISFITIILEYTYILNSFMFLNITIISQIISIIYYFAKSLIIFLRQKNKFNKESGLSNYEERNIKM